MGPNVNFPNSSFLILLRMPTACYLASSPLFEFEVLGSSSFNFLELFFLALLLVFLSITASLLLISLKSSVFEVLYLDPSVDFRIEALVSYFTMAEFLKSYRLFYVMRFSLFYLAFLSWISSRVLLSFIVTEAFLALTVFTDSTLITLSLTWLYYLPNRLL